MRTRSQARRQSRQVHQIEPAIEELEPEIPNMADTRTKAQRLQAPTGGFEFAIVPPPFNGNFLIKPEMISLVSSKPFRGNNDDEPHAHIRYFESITNTI